jgi:hypothetical protein
MAIVLRHGMLAKNGLGILIAPTADAIAGVGLGDATASFKSIRLGGAAPGSS